MLVFSMLLWLLYFLKRGNWIRRPAQIQVLFLAHDYIPILVSDSGPSADPHLSFCSKKLWLNLWSLDLQRLLLLTCGCVPVAGDRGEACRGRPPLPCLLAAWPCPLASLVIRIASWKRKFEQWQATNLHPGAGGTLSSVASCPLEGLGMEGFG